MDGTYFDHSILLYLEVIVSCLFSSMFVLGMKAEHKKRRKYRDPETCCTPPLAEDMLWTRLDDDPLGVYNDLGGRSSPTTPPPLRAVRLTPSATAIKISNCFEEVRNEAAKYQFLNEQELGEGQLASHDVAIKKYKNVKEQHYRYD